MQLGAGKVQDGLPQLRFQVIVGADDAAGCYILLALIRANVPGLYVFHRDEEIGGLGSNYFARQDPAKCLPAIKRCIAFDRKGFTSVITHQGMERNCSDEFAVALACKLGPAWRKDDTGIFTDSANYVDIIPECTNISVGYENEHTTREKLNVHFLEHLTTTLCGIDWDSLPTKRDPCTVEYLDDGWSSRYYGDSSRPYDLKHEGLEAYYSTTFDTWEEAYQLACTDPEHAADLLLAYCGTVKDKRRI